MKKQYWIIGNWEEIRPGVTSSLKPLQTENNVKGYENPQFAYLRRILPTGREILLELNQTTGEKLLLTPLEQAIGKGILQPGWEDDLLDYISAITKKRGYFPIREIDLPAESLANSGR